jgi:hypothetical protein
MHYRERRIAALLMRDMSVNQFLRPFCLIRNLLARIREQL